MIIRINIISFLAIVLILSCQNQENESKDNKISLSKSTKKLDKKESSYLKYYPNFRKKFKQKILLPIKYKSRENHEDKEEIKPDWHFPHFDEDLKGDSLFLSQIQQKADKNRGVYYFFYSHPYKSCYALGYIETKYSNDFDVLLLKQEGSEVSDKRDFGVHNYLCTFSHNGEIISLLSSSKTLEFKKNLHIMATVYSSGDSMTLNSKRHFKLLKNGQFKYISEPLTFYEEYYSSFEKKFTEIKLPLNLYDNQSFDNFFKVKTHLLSENEKSLFLHQIDKRLNYINAYFDEVYYPDVSIQHQCFYKISSHKDFDILFFVYQLSQEHKNNILERGVILSTFTKKGKLISTKNLFSTLGSVSFKKAISSFNIDKEYSIIINADKSNKRYFRVLGSGDIIKEE